MVPNTQYFAPNWSIYNVTSEKIEKEFGLKFQGEGVYYQVSKNGPCILVISAIEPGAPRYHVRHFDLPQTTTP